MSNVLDRALVHEKVIQNPTCAIENVFGINPKSAKKHIQHLFERCKASTCAGKDRRTPIVDLAIKFQQDGTVPDFVLVCCSGDAVRKNIVW